jgi:hypothetical protein
MILFETTQTNYCFIRTREAGQTWSIKFNKKLWAMLSWIP